jgi:hypothetical protein
MPALAGCEGLDANPAGRRVSLFRHRGRRCEVRAIVAFLVTDTILLAGLRSAHAAQRPTRSIVALKTLLIVFEGGRPPTAVALACLLDGGNCPAAEPAEVSLGIAPPTFASLEHARAVA